MTLALAFALGITLGVIGTVWGLFRRFRLWSERIASQDKERDPVQIVDTSYADDEYPGTDADSIAPEHIRGRMETIRRILDRDGNACNLCHLPAESLYTCKLADDEILCCVTCASLLHSEELE